MKKKPCEEFQQLPQKIEKSIKDTPIAFIADVCVRWVPALCFLALPMGPGRAGRGLRVPWMRESPVRFAWPWLFRAGHLPSVTLTISSIYLVACSGLNAAPREFWKIKLTCPREQNSSVCIRGVMIWSPPDGRCYGGMEKLYFLSAGGASKGEEVCAWLCQPEEYKVGSHMVSF